MTDQPRGAPNELVAQPRHSNPRRGRPPAPRPVLRPAPDAIHVAAHDRAHRRPRGSDPHRADPADGRGSTAVASRRPAGHRHVREDPLPPGSDHARLSARRGAHLSSRSCQARDPRSHRQPRAGPETSCRGPLTSPSPTAPPAQPAGPIISALGQSLPERRAQISAVSLVNQIGPEGNWNWHPEATIRLGATELYSALVAPGRMPARCGLSLFDVWRGNSTSE
jgi:hypothetical protein